MPGGADCSRRAAATTAAVRMCGVYASVLLHAQAFVLIADQDVVLLRLAVALDGDRRPRGGRAAARRAGGRAVSSAAFPAGTARSVRSQGAARTSRASGAP